MIKETITSDDAVTSHQTIALIQNESSVHCTTADNIDIAIKDAADVDISNVNFNKNREQWQRRASSQSNIKVIPLTPKPQRHSEAWIQRPNHTPDLVMDLPLVSTSSPKETTKKSISVTANLSDAFATNDKFVESPPGLESPDMQTAAETFAKQNQCTLKKNTKVSTDSSVNNESHLVVVETQKASADKPQVKTKPQVLKKPVFPIAASEETNAKDQPEFST